MALHAAPSKTLQRQRQKMQRQDVYKLWAWPKVRSTCRTPTLSTLWGSVSQSSTSTTCAAADSDSDSYESEDTDEIIDLQH